MAVQTSDRDSTYAVGSELASVIEEVGCEDLVLVNGTSRTWEVTDVVAHDLTDDPSDDRTAKRTLRLEHTQSAGTRVFGLVFEAYADGYEARLHVLDTPHSYEEDAVYAVDSVERLETVVPWVVLRGSADTYHFPDPVAAARGEAAPACGGPQGTDPEDVEHRFARIEAVYPAKRVCRNCAHRHQPRNVSKVSCPECGRVIGTGVLHGRGVDAVSGLAIECPSRSCDYEGVVRLADL